MTIRDMREQFTIEGGIVVKVWDDEKETYKVNEFLSEENEKEYIDRKITYMYPLVGCNGVICIELEGE